MTWTNWYQPTAFHFAEGDEIPYSSNRGVLTSVDPLVGISRSLGSGDPTLLYQEPTAVVFKGFGFDLTGLAVNAIELKLHVQRVARIEDKLIAVWNGEKPLGNAAKEQAADIETYHLDLVDDCGVPMNLDWDNWGVYVDLQPHQQYPSSNTAVIRSVKVRLDIASADDSTVD